MSTSSLLGRAISRFFRHGGNLDEGMASLHEQLGLNAGGTAHTGTTPAAPRKHKDATPEALHMVPTHLLTRSVHYAPDMDGQADPGEVVWVDIRPGKLSAPMRRAVLIVGRHHHTLLCLLISSNPEHHGQPQWQRIGTGPWFEPAETEPGRADVDQPIPSTPDSWDSSPQSGDCYVRLDKVLKVPESNIQRRGVSMPERRYDRIAARLREECGWH